LPYDGIADFWYKSFDDFESAYADEFYTNVVKKDEEYLFDMESLAVTAGVEQVVIEDGKVVDGPGQKTWCAAGVATTPADGKLFVLKGAMSMYIM
jgi:hypothetical protein